MILPICEIDNRYHVNTILFQTIVGGIYLHKYSLGAEYKELITRAALI